MQSLFLTAIGDARDKGARAVEAFAYRYGESDSTFERFQVHKTIFPSDFLAGLRLRHGAHAGAGRACAARARRPRHRGQKGRGRSPAVVPARAFVPAPAPQRF